MKKEVVVTGRNMRVSRRSVKPKTKRRKGGKKKK